MLSLHYLSRELVHFLAALHQDRKAMAPVKNGPIRTDFQRPGNTGSQAGS